MLANSLATRRADENIKKFITRKTKKRKGKESWIYINGTIDDKIFLRPFEAQKSE